MGGGQQYLENPTGQRRLFQPCPRVPKGTPSLLHAHSIFPVQPFSGSSDCYVATMLWDPSWAPSQVRGFYCAAGEVQGLWGRENWGFPTSPAVAPQGLSTEGVMVW